MAQLLLTSRRAGGRGFTLPPPLAFGTGPERGCPQPQHVRKGLSLGTLGQRCAVGAAAAGDSRAPEAVSGCALSWVFALLVLVATIDVPSQSIWIAGVVRTPFSTAFRLGPAALGVQGPITDHCSPPKCGPDPAVAGMRPAKAGLYTGPGQDGSSPKAELAACPTV